MHLEIKIDDYQCEFLFIDETVRFKVISKNTEDLKMKRMMDILMKKEKYKSSIKKGFVNTYKIADEEVNFIEFISFTS